MTHNQINYWNFRENQRHNVKTEDETNRHNLVTEGETERHNRVTEGIDLGKLNETIRHNKVTEGQGAQQLQLGYYSAVESQRHNLAAEDESKRHNQASEKLESYDLNIKAEAQDETVRHNTASESIEQFRAEADAKLKATQTRLNEIEEEWSQIQRSQNIALTEANKRRVEEEIKKTKKQIEDMDSQIKLNNQKYYINVFDEIDKQIDTLSNVIDAFIPG